MFKLFGAKKEKPKAQPREDRQFYQAYAADFLPDILDLLVVTGPTPFRSEEQPQSGLWEGSIGLTAWMEEDSPDIQQEPVELVILGAHDLVQVVHERLPANFILKLKGRLSLDGRRMLLVDLPAPGFDPDLKAILERQKQPVTADIEGIGTFTLSHAMGWFETEHPWVDGDIQLTFDRDADREASVSALRTLLSDADGWNRRLLVCAAGELLARLNRDLFLSGEAELDEAQFTETVQVESIQVGGDGSFTAVLNDNGLFGGLSILVTGDVTHGPSSAFVEGDQAEEL